MIKFNRYSFKFEFNFSTDLKPLHPTTHEDSAYGPIRILRKKSDGKLYKVDNPRSSPLNVEKRRLILYRTIVDPADCWNLVFFKNLDDMKRFDHMIPEIMEEREAIYLGRSINGVELIDSLNLLLIYEPK